MAGQALRPGPTVRRGGVHSPASRPPCRGGNCTARQSCSASWVFPAELLPASSVMPSRGRPPPRSPSSTGQPRLRRRCCVGNLACCCSRSSAAEGGAVRRGCQAGLRCRGLPLARGRTGGPAPPPSQATPGAPPSCRALSDCLLTLLPASLGLVPSSGDMARTLPTERRPGGPVAPMCPDPATVSRGSSPLPSAHGPGLDEEQRPGRAPAQAGAWAEQARPRPPAHL